MIPFNYHHLYYFYVIAEESSISRAAQQLGLAQPTLSAQLKQFENFLNVQLFTRENRKLILTEEGHKVLSYARLIFDIGQELKDRIVDLSHTGRPRVHIGITHFVPRTIVDLLMDFILGAYPDIYVELTVNTMPNLIINIENHLLDVILTDTPFESHVDASLTNKFIAKIPIVFCAHQRIAKQVKRFPRDLNNQPMILPAVPKQINYALKEFFFDNAINPNITGELEDIETVRRMALRGYGVAALNMLTVKEAPARQKLTIINPQSRSSIYEKIYIIKKNKKHPHEITEKIINDFHPGDFLSS